MSLMNLEEAKAFARIDHSAQDTVLPYLLDGIEEWIQAFCGLKFNAGDSYPELEEFADGGVTELRPPSHPIIDVVGVFDRLNDFAEYSSTLYYFDTNGIWLIGNGQWGPGKKRWQVHYTAGYHQGNLPAGLKMLILQLFTRAYQKSGGKESESIQGFSEKWEELLTSDEIKLLRAFSFRRTFF